MENAGNPIITGEIEQLSNREQLQKPDQTDAWWLLIPFDVRSVAVTRLPPDFPVMLFFCSTLF
jgi:hypothetical protein